MATAFSDNFSSTNPFINALVSDYYWSGTVSYYFQFGDWNVNSINDWSEDGARPAFVRALNAWSAVANITFQETTSAVDADMVEILSDAEGNLGFHYFPNNDGLGGEFNNRITLFVEEYNQIGGLSYTTLLHELGHGIGLNHPFEDIPFPGVSVGVPSDLGDNNFNQGLYTVMTYNDGYNAFGLSPSDAWGWEGTPMAFDIAAAQARYGANMATNAGDSVYDVIGVNGPGTYYSCIWDAGGNDTIRYTGALNVYIDLRPATLLNEVGGGGWLSTVTSVVAGSTGGHILGGFTIANGVVIERATGGSGNDTLVGNAFANVLTGNEGNDRLDGGAGNDTLIGGAGDDSYINWRPGDVIIETADGGTDAIEADISVTQLAANVENIALIGTGNLNATGNSSVNRLRGTTGNNILDGGGGADILIGGTGDDTYYVRSGTETISEWTFELSGGGNDTIIAFATYILPPDIENITLIGTAAANATGTMWDNVLRDNNGINVLTGGDGSDRYYISNAGDTVIEDNDYSNPRDIDRVFTTVSYTIPFEVEELYLTGTANINGTGDNRDNVIWGNSGINVLRGRFGSDVLHAGASDTAMGEDGNDLIYFTGIARALNGGVDQDGLVGDVVGTTGGLTIDARINRFLGFGTTTVGGFEYLGDGVVGGAALSATEFDDSVTTNGLVFDPYGNVYSGNHNNDHVLLEGGNDRFTSFVGKDVADGGTGIDTAVVDWRDTEGLRLSPTDRWQIRWTTGTGGRNVFVADLYRLNPDGTFNLSGTANFELTATNFENFEVHVGTLGGTFRGRASHDRLYGDLANDRLFGVDGNDTLIGNAGLDYLDGGNGNDRLEGGADNDTLIGGLGADNMLGGSGDDRYLIDNVGDVVTDSSGTADRVDASIDYIIGSDIEMLVLTGTAHNGTGNASNNRIQGNGLVNNLMGLGGDDQLFGYAGNDALNGGDGNDTLNGGAGIDSLTGGLGRDVFTFDDGDTANSTANSDRITDFSHAELDRIDLRLVDANRSTAADDAFTFIGNTAFTGAAGQLRTFVNATATYIYADTDGDKAANFILIVNTATPLVTTDFML